jgi:two-component sensor histidine kinase
VRVGGTFGVMFAKGKLVFNSQGEITGLFGVVMDISDRKNAEIRLQQQAEQQRLLAAMTQRARSSLNLEEILNTTVAEIHHALQANRVLVYQMFSNGTRAAIAESVSPEWKAVLNLVCSEQILSQEIYDGYLQGKVYALTDLRTEYVLHYLAEFLEDIEVRAKLVVSIIENQKLWGLLVSHQCDRPRQWQDWEIDLLQQLSNQLSIAIQQANLYKQLQTELTKKETFYLQLASELHQKKVLLKEVHHRVKNNLQVMSRLLRMQFRKATPELKKFGRRLSKSHSIHVANSCTTSSK